MVTDIIRNRLVAVSQNGYGIKYSDDNGETWTDSNITEGSYNPPKRFKDGTLYVECVSDITEPSLVSTDGGATWEESEVSGNVDTFLCNDGKILRSKLDGSSVTKDEDEIESLSGSWKFAKWEDPMEANRVCSGEGRELKALLGCTTIPELAAKLRAKGDSRDYSGLRLGDYFDFPSFVLDGETKTADQYESTRVEICGFGVFDRNGSTETGPGILFQCKNIPFKHRMEATNINTNIFPSTELGGLLNNATKTDLETKLGLGLRTVYRYFANSSDSSTGSCKVFLPSEVEVWGHHIWGTSWRNTYRDDVQWPIYRYNPQKRIKKYNGSQYWWWECNPAATSGWFCLVRRYGNADYSYANHADGGVPFAFYL